MSLPPQYHYELVFSQVDAKRGEPLTKYHYIHIDEHPYSFGVGERYVFAATVSQQGV